MHQLVIPGSRGSAVYISTRSQYREGDGWDLTVWHRHDGEGELCSGTCQFERLSLAELVDVLVAVLSDGNNRFRVDQLGDCSVDYSETPANSVPLIQ